MNPHNFRIVVTVTKNDELGRVLKHLAQGLVVAHDDIIAARARARDFIDIAAIAIRHIPSRFCALGSVAVHNERTGYIEDVYPLRHERARPDNEAAVAVPAPLRAPRWREDWRGWQVPPEIEMLVATGQAEYEGVDRGTLNPGFARVRPCGTVRVVYVLHPDPAKREDPSWKRYAVTDQCRDGTYRQHSTDDLEDALLRWRQCVDIEDNG